MYLRPGEAAMISVGCVTYIKSYTFARWQWSQYAVFRNAEECWKMIQDPQKNSDHQQNLNDSSFAHTPPLQKIS